MWRALWNATLCSCLWPLCLLPGARFRLCPEGLPTQSLTLQLHGCHRPHRHPGVPDLLQQLGSSFALLQSRLLGPRLRPTLSPSASVAASAGTGRRKRTAATSGRCLPKLCTCLRTVAVLLALPFRARSVVCAFGAPTRGSLSFSLPSRGCFDALFLLGLRLRPARGCCFKDVLPTLPVLPTRSSGRYCRCLPQACGVLPRHRTQERPLPPWLAAVLHVCTLA